VRGRTIFFAVLAALSLLCGTAVARKGHPKVVHGSTHADHLKLGKADNRVFAAGGNDTVLGGAGRDRLRGGRAMTSFSAAPVATACAAARTTTSWTAARATT
jgi:hypothetical protein